MSSRAGLVAMHRVRMVVAVLTLMLLRSADLMQQGKWCYRCSDAAGEACREGTCHIPLEDTWVDHESFLHAPGNVEWGGGD